MLSQNLGQGFLDVRQVIIECLLGTLLGRRIEIGLSGYKPAV